MNSHYIVDTRQPDGGYIYTCVLCKVKKKDLKGRCPAHDSHNFHAHRECPDANDEFKCDGCGCLSDSDLAKKPCKSPKKQESSGGRAHWLDYAMDLGM